MEVITVRMSKGQRAWAFTHQTIAEFHGHIRTARFRLESASVVLHPLMRAPLLALADTVYWGLMLAAGLAVVAVFCLVLAFVAVVLLVPSTFVFITVINYIPSDETSYDDNVVGTGIALSTVLVPFLLSGIASLVYFKYPELEDVDFMGGFYDPLPLAMQMLVCYALLELGLVCLVLITFDFCVVMYWGGYGISSFFTYGYQLLWELPWYVSVAVALPIPFIALTLARKVKHWLEVVNDDEQSEEFWLGSEENGSHSLQHETRLMSSPVPNSRLPCHGMRMRYENFWTSTGVEDNLLTRVADRE
ncbi:hypothetical protein R1flu_024387 [Riccia fluitans]|uniref:Uncharacterized protein n=1 Tax=Riccia fluitans TaxID=41844 RepID=A0ABD1XUR0_9MARC